MASRPTRTKAAKAAEQNTPEGASGTAREAPSAGSGAEEIDASAGTQSAPPSPIPAPQQPDEASGRKAEPEAELVEGVDGEAAQATAGEVTLGQPSPETGEASEGGSAAAAPAAVPFDPVAFVAGLSEAQLVKLAMLLNGRPALVAERSLNPPEAMAAGNLTITADEPVHVFTVDARLKKDGRYFEPGASVLLTRKEHGELKAAGVVSADWPD
ncbi:Uncharacterised protein [Starkeya nomas]|uniref:Uncharacterized protein n=1 Tax=Starkeya nomas TaxID=2666134 RepID=A0A5S9R6S6_9HYPH|nr:hypothetical protein [Starkeya nomas]CAA0129796.1 Uncharacterised protein [Starkeya nomas]